MKIVASIQARMGSSRLPGKVLKHICGKPMLLWHVERVKRSRLLDDVIVATTTSKKDDEIVSFCKQHAIPCYRGSEDDVLNRIASLICHHHIDVHLEFCGDSPLTDPQIIDEFVGYYLKHQSSFDYVSSAMKTTYPPGQEVIVYRGGVLCELDKTLSSDDPMREHVGYNITRFPDRYRLASLEAPDWFYEPEAYLEVDTPIDLEMMRQLIGFFVDKGIEHFTLSQILDLLKKQPEIMQLNNSEVRRWKSLREDTDA
jgi:spore coat polysaccharide biosynthesis protein SpsF